MKDEKQLTLFLITTAGLGDFYVLATSADKACDMLAVRFQEADYGFDDHRRVTLIKPLTYEQTRLSGKPFFSNKNNTLII
jgi:hypothetical protein